jgi:hypothetical protein
MRSQPRATPTMFEKSCPRNVRDVEHGKRLLADVRDSATMEIAFCGDLKRFTAAS